MIASEFTFRLRQARISSEWVHILAIRLYTELAVRNIARADLLVIVKIDLAVSAAGLRSTELEGPDWQGDRILHRTSHFAITRGICERT